MGTCFFKLLFKIKSKIRVGLVPLKLTLFQVEHWFLCGGLFRIKLSAPNITFYILFSKSNALATDHMTDSLRRDFEKLEKEKAQALNYLRSQPEDRLALQPPAGWCMIQAFRHIQISEDLSLQYMQKKSKAGDEMLARQLKPRVWLQVLYVVFALGLKFKMPAMLAGPQITRLEDLERDWNETREKLKNFIEAYPEKWNKKAVYKHPFVGMLNLQDTVRFFSSHLRHHVIQVKRIDRALRKS